jgi:hypothetical protein
MGNGNACCCCCANDESSKRDKELDAYIKKHHINKYPHKVPKYDKNDYQVWKQDFANDAKTFKAKVVNEILDENARK